MQEHKVEKSANDVIVQELELLKRRLDIMEWDLKRDQLSPAMRAKFDKLKQEYSEKIKHVNKWNILLKLNPAH